MVDLSMRLDFRSARTCRVVTIVTAIAAIGEALAASAARIKPSHDDL
jgi:hypothetical protein